MLNREVAGIEIWSEEVRGQTEYRARDNGVGVDQTYASTLFQAFCRPYNAREYGGKGVGFAIVQRIIDRHGGRIRVESKPGSVTTFFFTPGCERGAPGPPASRVVGATGQEPPPVPGDVEEGQAPMATVPWESVTL